MIYKKIAELQLPRFDKDASNPHFKNKYITLDQIMAKIRPILKAKGLVTYHSQSESGLETGIVDTDTGEKITTFYPIPSSLSGQKLGSELTYARRYSICLLLAIVADEDDDGHKASIPEPKAKPDISKFINSAKSQFAKDPNIANWAKEKCQMIESAFDHKWAQFARMEIDMLCVNAWKMPKIFNVSSVTLDENGEPI